MPFERPFAVLIALVALAAAAPAAAQDLGGLPPGPGAELVFAKCQSCHSLQYVTDSAGLPPFLWEDTVHEMIRNGLQVTDEERETIIEYLGTWLGPNPPEPTEASAEADGGADDASGDADAGGATDADGAALYATNCSGCHGAEGQGAPGAFPPLAGHARDLHDAEGGRTYLVDVLLHGLRGPIEVDGTAYDGVMPPWGHLEDAEIAAILNHVLIAWNEEDGLEPYAEEEIAERRGRDLDAGAVHAERPEVASGE